MVNRAIVCYHSLAWGKKKMKEKEGWTNFKWVGKKLGYILVPKAQILFYFLRAQLFSRSAFRAR